MTLSLSYIFTELKGWSFTFPVRDIKESKNVIRSQCRWLLLRLQGQELLCRKRKCKKTVTRKSNFPIQYHLKLFDFHNQ